MSITSKERYELLLKKYQDMYLFFLERNYNKFDRENSRNIFKELAERNDSDLLKKNEEMKSKLRELEGLNHKYRENLSTLNNLEEKVKQNKPIISH